MEEYGLHSSFDLEKHKKTFVNYLEVLIEKDGTIRYAVPSHQELAKRMACCALDVTGEELDRRCPPEYYCDYLNWLLMQSGAIAVWEKFWLGPVVSRKQYAALRRLKLGGVYKGSLPEREKINRNRH